MARVRSTARVTRVGEEAEGAETAPISEVMKRSGLVASEEAPATEIEQANVEETESEDDYDAAPTKPTALISKVMKRSGLVASEEAPATETEQADVEETESEDDYSAVPSKPSHLDFGKSTISEDDLPKLLNLGYFSEAKKELVRFGGEETTPKPRKDEVVVFKSFFKAGLRFPLNKMLKQSKLMLKRLSLKMITAQCQVNPAIWTSGNPPSPKMICLSC